MMFVGTVWTLGCCVLLAIFVCLCTHVGFVCLAAYTTFGFGLAVGLVMPKFLARETPQGLWHICPELV